MYDSSQWISSTCPFSFSNLDQSQGPAGRSLVLSEYTLSPSIFTRHVSALTVPAPALAKYKSYSRAQKLASFLQLPPYDPQAEKYFNDTQRIHLPARDNWEYHPSLIQFPSWEQQSPRPLYWISGPESGPGVSWVSSFSVDLIDALSVNESLIAAYVFCCNGNEGEVLVFKTHDSFWLFNSDRERLY